MTHFFSIISRTIIYRREVLSVLPALTPAEIISQILGILALVCNIFCYQMKSPKKLLFWQITASVMWILNLGIKGAVVGVLLNVHAVVRLTVYYLAENHKWARSKVWLPVFMISAAAIVILTYTGIPDALALIGTLCTIYSFSAGDTAKTRLFTLPSPPCWFVYHLMQKNLGGVLNEVFVFTSIIVGMLRLDRKKVKDSGNIR